MTYTVPMMEVPGLGCSVSTYPITVLDWNSIISIAQRRGMTHNLGRELSIPQSRWDIAPKVFLSWTQADEWCQLYSLIRNKPHQLMSFSEWTYLTKLNPKLPADVRHAKSIICQIPSDPNQYGLYDLRASIDQWVRDDRNGWRIAVGLKNNPLITLYNPTFFGKKSLGFRIVTANNTDQATMEFLCGTNS